MAGKGKARSGQDMFGDRIGDDGCSFALTYKGYRALDCLDRRRCVFRVRMSGLANNAGLQRHDRQRVAKDCARGVRLGCAHRGTAKPNAAFTRAT